MKKLVAVLLVLFMLFGFAQAEETAEYSWSNYEEAFEKSGVEAEFVTFEDVGVKILIPKALPKWELSAEEIDHGFIFYYADEKEETYVGMTYVPFETLEDYHNEIKGVEPISDIRQVTINGIPAVTYQVKSNDSMSIAFVNDAGKLLEVTVRPLSQEGAEEVWDMVISSIQLVK